jgi:hypothetical protein
LRGPHSRSRRGADPVTWNSQAEPRLEQVGQRAVLGGCALVCGRGLSLTMPVRSRLSSTSDHR